MFLLGSHGVGKYHQEEKPRNCHARVLYSFKEHDDVEGPRLNETANKTSNPQETMNIIHWYEDIIKTQNRKAKGYSRKQEQFFKKFKDTEYFLENAGQRKSITSPFTSFSKKHSMLKKLALPSSYFRKNLQSNKSTCKNIRTCFLHK